uniref:Uncharacterized protein n=1 Tax=Arundo donax TaxID=35708 RepID=A0A0A8ZD41_ARUDO
MQIPPCNLVLTSGDWRALARRLQKSTRLNNISNRRNKSSDRKGYHTMFTITPKTES